MQRHSIVTGGAGFLGSHLVDALLARGDRVTAVDNLVGCHGSPENVDHLEDDPAFTLIVENLLDWADPSVMEDVDTVFHQAASKNTVSIADPESDLIVNGLGTLRLLLACKDAGVRKFVHGSTGSVFGELSERQDETHPTRPRSFYGVSKLAGESYCRVIGEMYGLDTTVLRYYHIIGTRQDDSDTGGVVPIFIRNCENEEPVVIFGTGEQVRSFTSVVDVVAANLLVAETPEARGQFYNCASAIRVSIQELANFTIDEMGSDSSVVYQDWRPGDIIDFDIDNSKILNLGARFNADWKSVVRGVIESRNTDVDSGTS